MRSIRRFCLLCFGYTLNFIRKPVIGLKTWRSEALITDIADLLYPYSRNVHGVSTILLSSIIFNDVNRTDLQWK